MITCPICGKKFKHSTSFLKHFSGFKIGYKMCKSFIELLQLDNSTITLLATLP